MTKTVEESLVRPILIQRQLGSIQERRDLAPCLGDHERVVQRRAPDHHDAFRIRLESTSQRVRRRKRHELPPPDDIRGKGGEIDDRLERGSIDDWHIRKQTVQVFHDESQCGRPFGHDGVRPPGLILLGEVPGELSRAVRIREPIDIQVLVVDLGEGKLLAHDRLELPRECDDAGCIGIVRVDHHDPLVLLHPLRANGRGGRRSHDSDEERTEHAAHAGEQRRTK